MQAELFAPHQGRILVVDDASANIQAVTAILREHGYQISVATNGRQALSVLERVRPDLILLDVLMPEMDGFEACRRIKHNPDYQDIPIIFLTGKTDATDIVRGFELGAVDYVPKPFNAYELLARVNTHLTLDRLNRQNEQLLLNVLPAAIAEELKKTDDIIAERLDDVSVLFADIVGFTALSARLNPTELIEMLNRLFSAFDGLVDRHGLEKIKTIGDAYMVAGGLPEPRPGHLESMATLALDMLIAMKALPAPRHELRVRIGIHVGSVVAGVIGRRKFSYDVWGDTVNTASRLESHGEPGRIHVSEPVYLRLRDRFAFGPCRTVELKGKGPVSAYFLDGLLGESSEGSGSSSHGQLAIER
jgi:class 3 adenylate cyclase